MHPLQQFALPRAEGAVTHGWFVIISSFCLKVVELVLLSGETRCGQG